MSLQRPVPELRASDADRERTVERLHGAAVEGRLDAEELEERIDAAYRARWTSELARLTADVTPPPAPPAPQFPAYAPVPARRSSTNGLAVAALVAAFFWFWWLGSVFAVVGGQCALIQIKRSEGNQSGRGMAIAAIVLGWLELAALAVRIVAAG